MQQWKALWQQETLMGIGLMSGTSADGLDAALVEISGYGAATKVCQKAFVSLPYSEQIREAILRLASGDSGGTHEAALFSFLLGQLSLEACFAVCEKGGISPADVHFVGSHGQTLYHIPKAENYLGHSVRATLQLGEPSIICEGMGCPVVSDFRVRDMAAGGNGAPLVPYTEYLLYHSDTESVGLQNIGGIGNLTVLPSGGTLNHTYAFDTGPGNMVIDQLVERMTHGQQHYDRDGCIARTGNINRSLLCWMLNDPYLQQQPPKTTGREDYGTAYVERLIAQGNERNLSLQDLIATATCFTAACIREAIDRFCTGGLDRLIVGGGGSHNSFLMQCLREQLPITVQTGEDAGFDSDAKEAVAFAILANECLHGICNNVPSSTGAKHPVIMGKISF